MVSNDIRKGTKEEGNHGKRAIISYKYHRLSMIYRYVINEYVTLQVRKTLGRKREARICLLSKGWQLTGFFLDTCQFPQIAETYRH
jgi:hypothetical protein